MPSLWGDILWGDGGWGDDDPGVLDPFIDLGGNPLALPAQASAIFGDLATELETSRIYDMHTRGLRDIDAAGNLFWKRLCSGPEREWFKIEQRRDQLPSLYNVDTIDDEFLALLKLSALWTNDTDAATADLSFDSLRQLIAQSPELWDRRGSAGAYVEILNAIIGVDAFEVAWFDRRWVLDQTSLGAWGLDFGIMILDSSERNFINIHLADPGRDIDRSIVAEAVKLWRPVNQRARVVFVELLDRFDDTTNPKLWTVEGVGLATINPGHAVIPDDSIVYTAADYIETKSDYMVRLSIVPDSTAGYFGAVIRHQESSPTDALEFRVDMDGLTFEVYQGGAQLAGTVTVDLEALGFSFVAGYQRELRIEAQDSRFAVWLDNDPVYRFTTDLALPNGSAGALVGPGITGQMTFFEMLPLPGQVLTVGLGGQLSTTY
jgi:hypothetical protein